MCISFFGKGKGVVLCEGRVEMFKLLNLLKAVSKTSILGVFTILISSNQFASAQVKLNLDSYFSPLIPLERLLDSPEEFVNKRVTLPAKIFSNLSEDKGHRIVQLKLVGDDELSSSRWLCNDRVTFVLEPDMAVKLASQVNLDRYYFAQIYSELDVKSDCLDQTSYFGKIHRIELLNKQREVYSVID